MENSVAVGLYINDLAAVFLEILSGFKNRAVLDRCGDDFISASFKQVNGSEYGEVVSSVPPLVK